MKLHLLELTGFGPFRERQIVDFDAFDGDGVFLISGRTGAGKSSILDGVSFALYGSVPRYEGGERRLRSDHCFLGDPTEVRLEFTSGDRRLRVTRAPEYDRPAKRGGGLTTEPQRAELEERVGEVWVGLAAKPREVAHLLDEILGLNAQQFQQVILLAQNKFSRFLLATAAERQTLLRTLFGTRRFERYEEELETRRREAQRALDRAGEHARTLLEVAERLVAQHELGGESDLAVELPARREAISVALQRARYRVEAGEQNRDRADRAALAAEQALAAATAHAERMVSLHTAREELTRLTQAGPDIDAARERLRRARAAEALRAPLEAAERAEAARLAAETDAEAADAAWVLGRGTAGDAPEDAPGDDLAAVIERLTGDIAVWGALAAREQELAEIERALSECERRVDDQRSHLEQIEAQRALLPAERERLDGALAAARTHAERLDADRERRDTLAAQVVAARDAERLAVDADRAQHTYRAASEAAVSAGLSVTELLQRRLAGFAGELAAGLTDGQPCAVCGSTTHPHPAAPAPDAVTDDDLAAAESERERTAAVERDAREAAQASRDAHADAAARAGGNEVAVLESHLAAAEQELRAAEEALAAADALRQQRAALDEVAAEADLERDRVTELLAADVETAAGLRATAADLRAQVDGARGDHDSVAARVEEATRRRDLAREALTAQQRLAERHRAADAARADLDERVAASDFDSAAEAAEALLDEAARAALDERVTAHGHDLASAKSRLLELELQTVDVPDVDLDAARSARDNADAARTESIEALGRARTTAERLEESLRGIDDAYSDVEVIADDAATVTRLADTVAGRAPNTLKMDLETFVLAAELEEIVAAANLRLSEMSSGRYTLHHSDAKASHGRASGLGIDVLDAHTGRLRSPQSLSGGETFLASLALALGLAEVVTQRAGGLRLDTLFVDEGFGSLDPETLDLAMRTLDELRAGGRTVGVISHVETMKEQLPAQVVVEATGDGPSIIRQ